MPYFQAEFRFKRHLTGYYMCLFVPSTVAVFVSWASLWLEEHSPMRATLNVTPLALLVLQALLVVIRIPQQTCFWSIWWIFYLLSLFCSVFCVLHCNVLFNLSGKSAENSYKEMLEGTEEKKLLSKAIGLQWFRIIRDVLRCFIPIFWGLLGFSLLLSEI